MLSVKRTTGGRVVARNRCRRGDRTLLLALAILSASLASPSAAASPSTPRERVAVAVPDVANLQFLAFWIAVGAGYFADEGLDVDVTAPASPALVQSMFQGGSPPFAVLPAPDFERLVAEQYPIELVANLLANDPIELVMKREIAAARGIDRSQPLAVRLQRTKGLRIGVAPNPRARFDALYRSQGLDAAQLVHVETIRGENQDEAFGSGAVDALYAHTPYLERALLEGDGVLVVDQAGGEVPALAGRQIHALVVKRAFADAEPRTVAAMVHAIARAESLVHADAVAATDAILRSVTRYDRTHVAKLVELYAAAVPKSPDVSATKIARELAFFPSMGAAPDLSRIDLDRFVRARADRAPAGSQRGTRMVILLVFCALAVAYALGESSSAGRRDTSL